MPQTGVRTMGSEFGRLTLLSSALSTTVVVLLGDFAKLGEADSLTVAALLAAVVVLAGVVVLAAVFYIPPVLAGGAVLA